MFHENTINARSKNPAASSLLQKSVPTDVIGVGMRAENPAKPPSLSLYDLQDLLCSVFIVATVNEANRSLSHVINSHLGRTVNIVRIFSYLVQLIHEATPFSR
jgi:hypothetical protein